MSEDLPEGWAQASVGDAGIWRSGGTPSRKMASNFGGSIPWVKSGDLNDGAVTATEENLSERGVANSSAKLLPVGTVSVALYGATIGKLGVFGIAAATNQACANCQVDGRLVDRWFLFYYLLGQRSELIAAGQGGAQPNISGEILKAWPLPVPPLAEQRRIVAKVEALLAEVNAARERLAKVPAILKRFRQSVLAAACSGRLTEEWRSSRGPEADKAWATTPLELLCLAIVDCPHSTPKWTVSGKICLRTTNFFVRGLDLTEVRYVNNATFAERVSRLRPQAGDVVYSREGGILGIACIIPSGLEACLGQRMMLMRPDPAKMIPTYLCHYLNSPSTIERVRELTGGSASPHLNVGDIKAFEVPLPTLAEQEEIVRRVEAFFKVADAVEEHLVAATAQAEKITQAVLAKAFRGELVPTEAELAREEGREYEPASVLLERVRRELTEAPTRPTHRSKAGMSDAAGKLARRTARAGEGP